MELRGIAPRKSFDFAQDDGRGKTEIRKKDAKTSLSAP
jgi:hypothetical protein